MRLARDSHQAHLQVSSFFMWLLCVKQVLPAERLCRAKHVWRAERESLDLQLFFQVLLYVYATNITPKHYKFIRLNTYWSNLNDVKILLIRI